MRPDSFIINTRNLYVALADIEVHSSDKDARRNINLNNINYLAPEVLLGLEIDEKSDVWSVACIFYELLTSKPLLPALNPKDLIIIVTLNRVTWFNILD